MVVLSSEGWTSCHAVLPFGVVFIEWVVRTLSAWRFWL